MSRDKKLKIWDKVEGENSWKEACSRTFPSSVTALDVSPAGLILLGFESGDISVAARRGNEIDVLCELPRDQCATLTINTLQWRPGVKELMFAACSEDNSLLIVSVCEGLSTSSCDSGIREP